MQHNGCLSREKATLWLLKLFPVICCFYNTLSEIFGHIPGV